MKISKTLLLLSWISSALLLTGCNALLTDHMPKGGITMEHAYQDAMTGDDDALTAARAALSTHQQSMSHIDAEQDSPKCLPNPNIKLYVYPHLVGSQDSQVLVPGYTTEFPLYTHVYYALPNEAN